MIYMKDKNNREFKITFHYPFPDVITVAIRNPEGFKVVGSAIRNPDDAENAVLGRYLAFRRATSEVLDDSLKAQLIQTYHEKVRIPKEKDLKIIEDILREL